jgi:hypothetical protein
VLLTSGVAKARKELEMKWGISSEKVMNGLSKVLGVKGLYILLALAALALLSGAADKWGS